MPSDRWDPPLSERLEARVDDLDAASGPGVYVLECDVPASFRRCLDRWEHRYEVDPAPWLQTAYVAAKVLYVGAAANVRDRLNDHVYGDRREASFLALFPPRDIHDIRPMDSADNAFQYESGIAIDLDNQHPDWFVWQQ